MTVLPFIGAILLLAQVAAMVVALTQGAWLVSGLLLAGAVASWFVLRALVRRSYRAEAPARRYVEREQTLW